MFFDYIGAGTSTTTIHALTANCRNQAIDPEDHLIEVNRHPPGLATPAQGTATHGPLRMTTQKQLLPR